MGGHLRKPPLEYESDTQALTWAVTGGHLQTAIRISDKPILCLDKTDSVIKKNKNISINLSINYTDDAETFLLLF